MRVPGIALLLIATTTAWAAPRKRHPPQRRPPVSHPAPPPTPAPATSESPPSTGEAAPAPSSDAAPAAASDTPAASEAAPSAAAAASAPEPTAKAVDLDALNAEYNQLRDELFRSRAKAHLIGDALFKTKVVATFQYKAQRAWPLKKVTLAIDDQPVFTADAPSTQDPLKLYDGFVAPGRHTLTVHVDCGATGEERVAYGAQGSFVVDVPENKQANVGFVVDETGDGPSKLAKKHEGTFDVRVRADVETTERTK